MSKGEIARRLAIGCTSVRRIREERRTYPTFPNDPTDEALARDWTLCAEDLAEVRRCRGHDNRHRFAMKLCALRALGRFADDIENVPVRVASHIGGQLGLPASLFVSTSDRVATESEQAQRIRAHLEYTRFDETAMLTASKRR